MYMTVSFSFLGDLKQLWPFINFLNMHAINDNDDKL